MRRVLFVAAALVVVAGCSARPVGGPDGWKVYGPSGPQGVAGPAGLAGAAGPQGIAGVNGIPLVAKTYTSGMTVGLVNGKMPWYAVYGSTNVAVPLPAAGVATDWRPMVWLGNPRR